MQLKPSHGACCVVIVSFSAWENDRGEVKPRIIKLYEFTKSVIDIVDQLNDYYTARLKFY